MIRSSNSINYVADNSDIRSIRHGNGLKHMKYQKRGSDIYGNGIYGNGIYNGDGVWDSVKSGAKQVGNFVLDNADKIGKVVDVVHKTTKAGIDIAKDVNDLHRTKELRKSQEESLRSKKPSKPSESGSKNDSDASDAIFKKLRLQSQAIKKGKGLFLN